MILKAISDLHDQLFYRFIIRIRTSFIQMISAFVVITLSMCLADSAAQAQLAVDSMIVDFADPKLSRQDIVLSNNGNEVMYVEIEPEELVLGPRREPQGRSGTPDELGLLVTPNRMVLAPGQRRPVRAVLLQRPEVERIYRVTIKPVVGDALIDPALAGKKKALDLKVMVGYRAILLVRPAKIEEKLQSSREGHKLRFVNQGNVSMMLDFGRQCATPETPPASCATLPSKRVWPGMAWEVDLPQSGPASYTVEGPSSGGETISY